jgi:hypothetical protein
MLGLAVARTLPALPSGPQTKLTRVYVYETSGSFHMQYKSPAVKSEGMW